MPEKINKMPEFYTIFCPKKNSFCPNLGGGQLPPAPVSYAYDTDRVLASQRGKDGVAALVA